MLTAAEARLIKPNDSVTQIITDIEASIRSRATVGVRSTEITALIPNWQAWNKGQSNPDLDAVKAAIEKAGYKLEISNGSAAARGFVRISWDA